MAIPKYRLGQLILILLIVSLLFGGWAKGPSVYAADCVAGPHSGTLTASQDWCPQDNPHLITGAVTVPDGVTLTLRPGVIVKAYSGTYLYVAGTLTAIGTPSQPITLTSSADSGPGQWGGIFLHNGEADLRHVTLRYAGQSSFWSDRAAIYVAYSTLNLENSVVRDSAYASGTDYGVLVCCTANSASAVISNTLFANLGNSTADYAVYTDGSTNPITVTNSIFQNNAGYPIHTVAEVVHQITGNTFSDNGFNRILVGGYRFADQGRLTAQTGLEGYELKEWLELQTGHTLFIDPGVMLMTRSNKDIRIHGHLEAMGTPTQPITFTSAANTGPGQWGSLYIQEGSADLRYVTIRYGGQLISGNTIAGALLLQSTGGTPKHFNLDHVTVRDNAYSGGTSEYALSINGGTVTMNATSVISNGDTASDYGIYIYGGVVTATHSLVQNNAGRGVHIAGGRLGMTCGTVSGNGGDGIHIGGGSGSAFIGTGIYNNAGMGLNNTTAQTVTATYNWWGDPSGPGGQGPGSGDEVSANVAYAPWLSSEGCFTGLFIGKTAEDVNGAPLYADDLVRYTIQVTNTGSIMQTNLVVTDTLPSGVTFVSASPSGYAGPNPLKWTVGTLAPGAWWTATVTVTVNSGVAAIGGNVAQASSEQQPTIQTEAVLPPGGGVVYKRVFLPLVIRQ